MSRPTPLPIPWTPQSAPRPVTPARPAAAPAPADRPTPARRQKALPTAPHPLRTLPARTLPTPDAPAPSAAVPAAPASSAAPDRAVACDRQRSSLTAAVAVRHGVALQRPETLRALLDVDDAGLAELVADGTVLEVPLGAGRRVVLADAVPAHALTDAARAAEGAA